jgi:hypothetical protein
VQLVATFQAKRVLCHDSLFSCCDLTTSTHPAPDSRQSSRSLFALLSCPWYPNYGTLRDYRSVPLGDPSRRVSLAANTRGAATCRVCAIQLMNTTRLPLRSGWGSSTDPASVLASMQQLRKLLSVRPSTTSCHLTLPYEAQLDHPAKRVTISVRSARCV